MMYGPIGASLSSVYCVIAWFIMASCLSRGVEWWGVLPVHYHRPVPAPKRQYVFPDSARPALRRDPAAKAIARAWRMLTGGGRGRDGQRRTLLACSGGTDSAALVLALAAHAQDAGALVVGHVVHDMRPRTQTLPERDRVRGLAAALGLRSVDASIKVKSVKGNAEAVARERRYRAIAELADACDCGFVATAHQGDDLLETMFMRLVRGTGVRGLVAVHESRPLDCGSTLIRPMLGVTRADAERICAIAKFTPSDDPTNRDTTRLRARLRRDVLPVLREVAPDVHLRVLETSRLMAGLAGMLDATLLGDGQSALSPNAQFAQVSIPRDRARAMPAVVLAELLRAAVRRCGGKLDRLPARTVAEACRVVQSPGTDPKRIALPGLTVRVTAREVELCAR
jgi:tRNA(Ile)-lysidine synthase